MYCKNCGADLPENAVFCGNCGMKVSVEEPNVQEAPKTEPTSAPTYQPRPEQRTYQTYSQVPPTPPQYQQVNSSAEIKTTLWIVLSIIEIVTCCAFVPGVIGLVFAIMASNKAKEGKFEEAQSNIKTAKIAVFIGIGLFFFGGIISTVTGAVSDVINEINF